MSIEAMRQALDALESAADNECNFHDYKNAAITLRQAIEQAEKQEPVAWVYLENWGSGKFWPDDCFSENNASPEMTPLYTAPPRIKFPVALRKMWTGQEVQQWLDEHVNKENL
jgi:hypothetical protein